MEATIIYPHQLYTEHPGVTKGRTIYFVEEPLFFTEFPVHAQKLMLHRLSMKARFNEMKDEGHDVHYIEHSSNTTKQILQSIVDQGIKVFHIADTTDTWLEKRIGNFCAENTVKRVLYESSLFLLDKQDAINRYQSSKKFMHRFYQSMRKDFDVLMEDGSPVGGKWSFDHDNRKKLPKNHTLPNDITYYENEEIEKAEQWVTSLDADIYGTSSWWLPYTRTSTLEWFNDFLEERFNDFGTYEDAMTTQSVRIYHSAISPLINIGLISPQEIIEKVLAHAQQHDVPINSVEGFVRQIIGWREFIRASYEHDGTTMRNKNFFKAPETLSECWWKGMTEIDPLDHAIKTALEYGYTHHIERLMVIGNAMLLSHIHPDEVYKWFMAMYVDAYDWVMVPNVYGMSQFADGGSFATKPYIAGANYIKKMSDHAPGAWNDELTGLYWNFINTHINVFKENHRMAMMPRLLEKMDKDKKEAHIKNAHTFLERVKSDT